MLYYLLILLASILGSFGQIFLKLSRGKLFTYEFILGGLLYVLAMLIYVKALKHIPLSVAYPTLAISYIFVTILSYFLFNEQITLLKIVGVLLIFLGVSLVGIAG